MVTSIQKEFKVKNGMVVRNTATFTEVDGIVTTSTDVISLPTLNLNFLSGTLDPRIAFSRASGATLIGSDSYIKYVGNNTPRFDYSSTSTGTCLGLLMEEQRSNLYKYSGDIYTGLSYVFWDGSLGFRQNTLGTTTSTVYNLSLYVKVNQAASGHTIMLDIGDGTVPVTTLSTLTTGTWTRITNTGSQGVSGDFADIRIQGLGSFSLGGTNFSGVPGATVPITRFYGIAPDGSKTSTRIAVYNTQTSVLLTDLEIWGFQVETGRFPTSYIPTGASQATRASDYTFMSGQNFNNWYNQTAGTFYVENDGTFTTSSFNYPRILHVGDGSVQSNTLQYIYNLGPNNASNISFTNWYNGAYTQAITGPSNLVSGASYKSAFTYSLTQLTGSIQGGAVTTASMSQLPTISNQMGIGGYSFSSSSSQINGHMKRVQYWPSVLPQTQLRSLTTATVFSNTNFASTTTSVTKTSSTSNFIIKQGLIVSTNLEIPDVDKLYTDAVKKPTQQPSLNLNFLRGTLDPRISFTRASGATVIGPDSYIKYVGNNTPRFDYSSTSTGTCRGLLMEEQRTNLHTYSSAFATNWANNGNAIMARNSVVAPDGGPADVMTNTPNVGSYIYGNAVNLTSSTVYTRSMYGKGLGGNNLLIMEGYDSAANNNTTARFDVSTGTVVYVGTGTGSIVNAGNGWWRCSWTFTSSTGTTDNSRVLYVGGYGTTPLTVPIAIWGSQLEQGTFATSYIPTMSATATRSVDLAVMNGQNLQSWFNMSQGTLYTEADSISSSPDATNTYRWVCSLSTGYGQKIGFFRMPSYGGFLPKIADDGYTSRFEPLLGNISTSTVFKAALSYSSGKQYASLNYVSTNSGTSTLMPRVIDNLRIGNGDSPWCGHIRKIAYYPEQLSNTATRALTAI